MPSSRWVRSEIVEDTSLYPEYLSPGMLPSGFRVVKSQRSVITVPGTGSEIDTASESKLSPLMLVAETT